MRHWNNSGNRLAALRKSMKDKNIDAYLIPSTDPHLGEYVPDFWSIIPWLTGFTGSSATVVITDSFAGLWTDSRYFIQAEEQLKGSGIALMKPVLPENNDINDWLKENIKERGTIGLDGSIFSITWFRKLDEALQGGSITIDPGLDLITEIWNDRPLMPDSKAFEHDIEFCGVSRREKIERVRALMQQTHVDYHLLTSVDDIMWLLNIRGSDVRYSPLLSSYAVIGDQQVLFFADENKIPLKLASEFDRLDIVILPYGEIAGIVSALPENSSILITPSTTSVTLNRSIPKGMKIKEGTSIPAKLKSVKNTCEISNIERVMVKDGAALTKFFFWLENSIGKTSLTELSIEAKLVELRSDQKYYLGPSFRTIAAFNEHGALPHYNSSYETDSKINGDGVLLIDSGGQYLDGTTDITRTIVIGRPSAQQKRDFTLVLKGMINLATAKFPSTTKGIQLDIIARKALWEQGLNYGHGTGHGVGFCLNVHEGPLGISPGANPDSGTVIEPGMLISDEPAIYREGEYGIRIENLVLCYEEEETEFGKFLRFDTLSLCYIDKRLIDITLLEDKELDWINSYHSDVYKKLSPCLTPEEQEWLKEKTSSL